MTPLEGVTIVFPKGIEEIVRKVSGEQIKDEDAAAQEVINRIAERVSPEKSGIIERGTAPEKKSKWTEHDTIDAMNWAAKQYFKMLISDLRRAGPVKVFRDHKRCKAPRIDP